MPKVSVVMPVYNARLFLDEAVESILTQSFRDFEFILVDDGSSDGSSDILQKHAARDKRIRYHRQPENGGLVAALNDGIGLSSSQYIARMDADDISLPERLKKQVDLLDDGEVDLVGANYIKFPGPRSKTTRLPQSSSDVAKTMLYTCSIGHPVATFSREVFDSLGGYDTRYAQGGAEDYDLWLRFLRYHNAVNLAEPLLRYRLHGDSLTAAAKSKDRYVHNSACAVANHFAYLYDLDGVYPQDSDQKIANTLLSAIEKSNDSWHLKSMKRWLIRLTRYCLEDTNARTEVKQRLFPLASAKEKLKWRLYFRDFS